jgi:hypothetical protein
VRVIGNPECEGFDMGADDTRQSTKRPANPLPAQSPRAEQGKRALRAIRSGVGHAGRRATKISLPKLPSLEKLKP